VYGAFWTPETGGFGNIFTQFALTPDGGTIVLPDRGDDKVRLYDRSTGAELKVLSTASGPTGVDISLDGTTAVISHGGNPGTVTEIDLVSQTVTGSFPISEWMVGEVIRITPDKTHAMAAISNNVIFVNLTTGSVATTIYTGTVGAIEISHDQQYAFVSNYNARVIDIASQSLVKTITFAACAESATSPVENRAVALNNRFRENVHFYDINGASGFLEGYNLSGEPEEGDGTYGVDISSDGKVAVACNVVSENVCILDMTTHSVRSYVNVGDRPKEVRITPDNDYAVVCAMDANAVKIIDLDTDTVVKTLFIYNRPGRVRISPDSQYAYVLNVAGSDQISFIKLDGASSVIEKQLPAGQTGSANGYSYTETSGIELSDDGSLLAVCDSFNDYLRLFDTATQTQVAQVIVGDFPIRAAFNPAGDRVYVTNAFGDSLSIVEFDDVNWGVIDTVTGMDFPLTVDVDETDAFVYVGNAGSSGTKGIRVIDTRFFNVVKTISFGDFYARDSHLNTGDSVLYIASTNDELVRIKAAGPSSAILDKIAISDSPADMAFNEIGRIAIFAQPVPDGVDVVRPGLEITQTR
jgi:DNA-binding beta-propeller fold protein YncE